MGQLYFEVPLEGLNGDLDIEVEASFNHYQQQFNVDPAQVGSYYKNSELYRTFTKSTGNITYILNRTSPPPSI